MKNGRKYTRLAILAFSIMLVLGFMMNLRGTLIPEIKRDFGITYSNIGLMLLVSEIGYIVANFLGGIAAEKFGLKAVLVTGFIITMASITGMSFATSFVILVLLMVALSVGMGCFEIGLNSLGAKIFVVNAAIMMNFLHFFFGVGSSVSPRYAGWLLSGSVSWSVIYLSSLALAAIVFLFLITTSFPHDSDSAFHKAERIPVGKFVSDTKNWFFVGVLGFAIVTEVGIGTWLVNYLQVVHGMNEGSSSVYLSMFFIFFTAGRMVGGFIAERLGYIRIILFFTTAILVLFTSGLVMGGSWVILFSLTGFFISVMYPTVMTIIMKEYPENTPAAMGFIITGAGVVNMISNWIIGKASDILNPFGGFASILAYPVLLIICLVPLSRMLTYNKAQRADIQVEAR